jgi:hypothetical protein
MNALTPFLACPMCMSGAEGKTLVAANSAILALLVILLAVLASFLSFIFYLARRSRHLAETVTPELP